MKQAFPSLPGRVVTITREADDGTTLSASFSLAPWPIGYAEYLSRVFPPPADYVELRPVERPQEQREYQAQVGLLLLARSLGDQLDARAPGKAADRRDWEAYARAVQDELGAANLVDGDIIKLIGEASRVNRGAGKLGKGA